MAPASSCSAPPVPDVVDPTTRDKAPAAPPLALPVPSSMDPADPVVELPVRIVTEPVEPASVESPLPITTAPVLTVEAPDSRLTSPESPATATPEATVTAPEKPAAVVPELNIRAPDAPEDTAFADRIVTTPVEADDEAPDTTNTAPPVTVPDKPA